MIRYKVDLEPDLRGPEIGAYTGPKAFVSLRKAVNVY
jgi:hypothetical protein